MKKRLHFLAVLLVFVVALLCLASCQGTNSSTTTPTTMPIPSFEVVFVAGDGEILKTETVQLGQSATAPEVPDRTGYMFVGWDTDFSNVDCSMTVTAQYLRVWTVQFVDASGDEIGTFSVLDGEASPTPPIDPYKENHTFVGWDQDYSSVKSDMIIRPVFKELGKFTVTFLGFDGEVLKNQEVCQGESATAPAAPQIQHYTFKGWDKDFSSITADLTVNAIYEEDEKYTVCFYDYDGNLLKTEKLYAGEDATAPEVPQHDDLVFLGWDKNFDNVQTDLTVTAKYLQCYTVTFKGYDGTVLKVQKVYEGEGATAPAAPIREGYIFTGWDKTFDRVTGHLEIVAQYEIVKHNVIFSVPGGEAPATQVVEHGSVAMRPADPVRDGFDFIEWRLDGKKYDFSQLVTADMTLVAYFKSNGQVPAITNDTLKIDPYELELWVGITLQLNIMPNGETYDILANTDITFDFISTDPEVISIEDDGTFTSHALGSAKIYAVVTKGGTYVGSKGTYTAEVGDVIGICYMTVVETDEYYQNFLDDPENQKITLGYTSESRIDKNDFLVFPSGEYGSANIALWYNGTEAVFTATVDDNPNVMGDWAKWAVFADEFGIPTTFITPSLSGYANEGSLWQVISSSEYAMVQSHGATHLAINQHHSTARIWNEFYYGRKNINQTGGNDSLIIGYANGTNYAPISALFFISGRGVAGHLNTVDKINYNTLSSYSGFPNIETAMNTLLGENATNGWMSVHYHQMGNGADTIRGVYEYMYPYIEDGRLWAAIFADAAQYGQERDTATLTMLETGANVIRFTLTDQMNDILFYHPLSVRVKVDSTWTGA
ncbi:MAG: InlB B-repeat-containing protein, partial [Clostridia bacterium]|nr:InlB B-repeat-containing protein [Clostridia bacterium]